MHLPSAQTRQSRLRKHFPLLAVLLALLSTALAGEGVLWLARYSPSKTDPVRSFYKFDPVLGWRGKSLYTGRYKHRSDYDVVIAQDAAGFRKQVNLEAKLNKPLHQILVFGDSYVWGWGVGQGDVFTDKMNLLLPDYSVQNYGVCAIGTVIEYLLFATELVKLLKTDDIVILMFCNNDFGDNVDRTKIHAEVADGLVRIVKPAKSLPPPARDWLRSHSSLCDFVWNLADRFLAKREYRIREEEAGGRMIAESEEQFIVTRFYLTRFQADCEAAKTRFIVAHVPSQEESSEASANLPNGLANAKARTEALFSITRALHIETVDLLPGFLARKIKTAERMTFMNDPHWNVTGHQAAAELLSEYLSSHPAR